MRAASARALNQLATHEARRLAAAPGALPAVVSALGQAASRGDAESESLLALVALRFCMLDSAHARRLAAVPRALPTLVALLQSADGDALVNAAAAVQCIAGSGPDQAARVAEAGDTLAVCARLLAHPHPSAVANAASVLGKIAVAGDDLARRVSAAAMRPLIEALRHSYDRAATNAAAAIGAIARADCEHARVMAVAGALPPLRECLAKCGVEGEAAMNATLAIGAIAAASSEQAGRVSEDRAMLRLLGPVALRSSNADTVASAAWALASVAYMGGEHERRVAGLPGIVPLCLAALRLPKDDAVVNAASILAYISRANSDAIMREPGAAPALAAVLVGPCKRAVEAAAQALGNLPPGTVQAPAVIEAGALPRLLAMLDDRGSRALKASILLYEVACSPSRQRLVSEPGALGKLAAALGPAVADAEMDTASNLVQALAVLVQQLGASVARRVIDLPALLPGLSSALAEQNSYIMPYRTEQNSYIMP